MQYFIEIFDTFNVNNIIIKFKKIFVNYLIVQLFNQKIDLFNLVIAKHKLKVIVKLRFSKHFQQLKTYLKQINWLRNYIFYYIKIFKLLQKRKIKLLRNNSITNNIKIIYFKKIKIKYLIEKKFATFKILQAIFSKLLFLIHVNLICQLYINLNVNKKFDFNVMICWLKIIQDCYIWSK